MKLDRGCSLLDRRRPIKEQDFRAVGLKIEIFFVWIWTTSSSGLDALWEISGSIVVVGTARTYGYID